MGAGTCQSSAHSTIAPLAPCRRRSAMAGLACLVEDCLRRLRSTRTSRRIFAFFLPGAVLRHVVRTPRTAEFAESWDTASSDAIDGNCHMTEEKRMGKAKVPLRVADCGSRADKLAARAVHGRVCADDIVLYREFLHASRREYRRKGEQARRCKTHPSVAFAPSSSPLHALGYPHSSALTSHCSAIACQSFILARFLSLCDTFLSSLYQLDTAIPTLVFHTQSRPYRCPYPLPWCSLRTKNTSARKRNALSRIASVEPTGSDGAPTWPNASGQLVSSAADRGLPLLTFCTVREDYS